jgi:hypothetical protein
MYQNKDKQIINSDFYYILIAVQVYYPHVNYPDVNRVFSWYLGVIHQALDV